ncbi:SecY translocase [Bradymonas sediminis]|nr:SecY translocase [Bradymonas sediminis]
MLVEFAALIVPPWRKLRISGVPGRQKLRRASYVLGFILTAIQGSAMTQMLADTSGMQPGLMLISWLGACALIIGLLIAIERVGVGQGFSLFLLAATVLETFGTVDSLFAWELVSQSGEDLVSIVALLAVVGACWWIFRRPPTLGTSNDEAPPTGIDWRRWGIIAPTMGFVSLNWAYEMPTLIAAIKNYYVDVPSHGAGHPSPGWNADFFIVIGVLILGGIFASMLFYRQRYVLGLWSAVAEVFDPSYEPAKLKAHFKSAWIKAVQLSLAFVVVVFVADTVTHGIIGLLGAIIVGWSVAIAIDLQREISFRLQHGALGVVDEVHRLYVLPPELALIERRGIPVLARATCMRSLFHFFGPYIPIELMVPIARVEEAQEALELEHTDTP